MEQEVNLVFDIGKTHKKVLLFDNRLEVLHQQEERLPETVDEDGFPCEDAAQLERWMDDRKSELAGEKEFRIRGINFSTYGATLVHLDSTGNRCAPIYNYLKPLPGKVLEGFYERHEGVEEFSRRTASPALGMLNSGLQLLWIKKEKPRLRRKLKTVLHLPQYLSYRLTGHITSEPTSIGCHTAMWDFDHMQYHPWLREEGFRLPEPGEVTETLPVQLDRTIIETGAGIHDSSAALVPYLLHARAPFTLVSTGTWCITMNPFNREKLTSEELRQDCLCFLSFRGNPVKSSRFFMGHIHDLNVQMMEDHFRVERNSHRIIAPGPEVLRRAWREAEKMVFFRDRDSTGPGNPEDPREPCLVKDLIMLLKQFPSFEDAYIRFMAEITRLAARSVRLVLPAEDTTEHLYVTGGFSRNTLFTTFLALSFPAKKVFTSRVDNASSLGAAMVIHEKVFGIRELPYDLRLKEIAY